MPKEQSKNKKARGAPVDRNSKLDQWGQGWDYLIEDIWDNLDMMREDNLKRKYNKNNIDYCFKFSYSVLFKEVVPKINNSDWDKKDKEDVLEKTSNLIKLFKDIEGYPDKVIAVNATEQFLRSIYEEDDERKK